MKRNWFRPFFYRFSVEMVHNCDCCSGVWSEFHRCISAWFVQWNIPIFFISHTLERMDSRSGLPVPIYPTNFWVAKHEKLDLVGNDREFQISFDTSLPRIVGHMVLFLCFSFAVPSTTRSPSLMTKRGIENASSCHWQKVWLDSLFNQCNRSLLDSKKEGILSNARLEMFRISRITLHCPFDESSPSNRHWMGCRRFFATNRLQVLLDEDDSRSSWRVREHKSFRLVSHLHDAIQTIWSRCLFPRAVWTNRWIVHSQVSPFFQLGYWFLVGFVGNHHYLQQLLNPILSSNHVSRKFSDEVEVTHILSLIWFLQFTSQ